MNFKIILIGEILLILFLLSGCTTPDIELDNLNAKFLEINNKTVSLEEQIIVLEEGKEFLRKKVNILEMDKLKLTSDFVEVHKQYINCFWAVSGDHDFGVFQEHFKGYDGEVIAQGYIYDCYYNDLKNWDRWWEIVNKFNGD